MTAIRPFPSTPSAFPSLGPSSTHPCGRPATEVRFSRWGNGSAEPFERRRRSQSEFEDDIRRHRRQEGADRIAYVSSPAEKPAPSAEFKSRGTPSSPSAPFIRGRFTKYSKPPRKRGGGELDRSSADLSHPAFSPFRKFSPRLPIPVEQPDPAISIGENGISYKFEDAPFVFQYSYTETPKEKPIGLRETPYLPFGPKTMPRPWTGRAPLPPSKKKVPEFDSFNPPPPGKKGVKHVQAPGPFLAGSGPKHAATREEILGEPLTQEEVRDLVKSCVKSTRQLNMGRDGLTHNMLDNIHSHWKRRRVIKVKCKGVCTVDMDNVRQQLEEKSGGKVIYSRGGVLYLFRGRNYNYMTRPRFPLMLWKPTPPVYPRLVEKVPEGLTLEEATELRTKGRQVPPICKLGKNGVYLNLVKNVREAFEECELVRVDGSGINKNDCRKIGAKLKDLVPCVLLSFQFEHILMWRGKDWKSSLPPLEDKKLGQSINSVDPFLDELHEMEPESEETSDEESEGLISAGYVSSESDQEDNLDESEQEDHGHESDNGSVVRNCPENLDNGRVNSVDRNDQTMAECSGENLDDESSPADRALQTTMGYSDKNLDDEFSSAAPNLRSFGLKEESVGTTACMRDSEGDIDEYGSFSAVTNSLDTNTEQDDNNMAAEPLAGSSLERQEMKSFQRPSNRLMLLLEQAIETGSAVLLDNSSVDADIAFRKAVELAKVAAPGPVFQHSGKKIRSANTEKIKGEGRDSKKPFVEVAESSKTKLAKMGPKARRRDFKVSFPDVVPRGSLGVDELAKLLA